MIQNTKQVGRPVVMKTENGGTVTLPSTISKAMIAKIPQIPNKLNEIGGRMWVDIWITCKDWVKDKDKYIIEEACFKFQELQHLLNIRSVNNVSPIFTHSNKSKTIHPLWKMISDTQKEYQTLLKEIGMTPASFAAISKLESINTDDPLFNAIRSIQEDNFSQKKKVAMALNLKEDNEEDNEDYDDVDN